MLKLSKLLITLVLLAATVPPGLARASDPGIQRAESILAVKLKDGASARYLNVVHVPSKAGGLGTVCGWVNAKNSYGAYVGYRPFVVSSKGAMIRDKSDRGHSNQSKFDAYWFDTCFRNQRKKITAVLPNLPDIDIKEACKESFNKLAAEVALYITVTDSIKKSNLANCEKAEVSSREWLKSHTTDESIADRCVRKGRKDESYKTIKSCIVAEQARTLALHADLIFSRGPPVPTRLHNSQPNTTNERSDL